MGKGEGKVAPHGKIGASGVTTASMAELYAELATECVVPGAAPSVRPGLKHVPDRTPGCTPSCTLITPNRRLAAFHKREFDRAQQQAGRLAWQSPDILPYPSWVERTWRDLSLRAETRVHPQLLDSVQSQLLWEQIVRKSDASFASGLLNVAQTSRQAASAWTLARAWHLLPAMRKFPLHDDAAMFLAWTDQYQQLCREQRVIDSAVLPDALADMLGENAGDAYLPVTRILTVGFDIVTPQQHHLWRAMGEAGIEVRAIELQRKDESASRRRLAFASGCDELRACAAWARQQIEKNPQRRIAIVVPDLQSQRSRVARELTDALLPGARADSVVGQAPATSLFNISIGQPLGDYALVRDALELLAFSLSPSRAMPFLAVSALLRSPFIAAAEKEHAARAALDAKLRETASPEIHLMALRKKLANDASLQIAAQACGELGGRLDRVGALAEAVAATYSATRGRSASPSPHDWSRHFGAVLTAWGFPGERPLDSIDFQVMAKFRDALSALATLAAIQPRMRADDALLQLRRIVADSMFQPEANADAPIQVLGILESAGQTFDALWVTGLSDAAWPLAVRPNPFIPARLQRSAGVTEASAPASLKLDRRITAGWLASADEVVLTHARPEGDSEATDPDGSASALIRDIPLSPLSAVLGGEVTPGYAVALQALRRIEAIPDAPHEPLPAPTALRGGAAVIRDQAACPFRAFARHRLGARPLEAPQPGLDSAERGNLLHRVLYLVWETLPDHAALMALNADALTSIADEAAMRAIAEAHAKGAASLTGRFAAIERARLSRVAGEWLEYERERQPFTVLERESPRKVELCGLTMDLRLDRLDRLADGTHALIDYKTGDAKLASWLGDRPDEPQLPLYYCTADEEISALAFARVKRGERGKTFGFEGVSAAEGLLPDVTPIEQKTRLKNQGYVSWDVLTAEWERSLAYLASGFVQGDATVDPKHRGLTCAQCDLQSVCRVAELTGYGALEVDADTASAETDSE